MMIETKYEFGQGVYLRTDPDQMERVITSINLKPGNILIYELSFVTGTSYHYDFEFSSEKDLVKSSQ